MIRPAMAAPLRFAPIKTPRRGAHAGRALGLALVIGLGAGATTATIPTAAHAATKEPPLPSSEELRQLQLLTLACGRDNTAEPCQKARDQADPLMDHPRLSGSCKDALWTIREKAVVVPGNSYERRQQLSRAGTDVTVFCKPLNQPIKPRSDEPESGKKRSGFGLLQGN